MTNLKIDSSSTSTHLDYGENRDSGSDSNPQQQRPENSNEAPTPYLSHGLKVPDSDTRLKRRKTQKKRIEKKKKKKKLAERQAKNNSEDQNKSST